MARRNTGRHRKDVREKLLDVAERLFAERGFEGVSVRDITTAARCNVASVSYYFGNKKNLYLAVFRERMAARARKVQEAFWHGLGDNSQPAADQIIRTLVMAFLKSPFSERQRILHHKLMAKEIANPTEAFEVFFSEVIIPFFEALQRLLEPFFPDSASEQHRRLYVLCIIALVMHFNLARNMVSRITGQKYTDEFVEGLIEYITGFSLYGLKGYGGGSDRD